MDTWTQTQGLTARDAGFRAGTLSGLRRPGRGWWLRYRPVGGGHRSKTCRVVSGRPAGGPVG